MVRFHNMKRGRTKPYTGTQAVLRAISLLKVFTDERSAWSLPELVKHLGLNKTTIFRLLTALQSEGLISHNGDNDTYSLGSEMIVLGGHALRSHDLRSLSRAELKSLAQITGESVTLEILVDREVLIIDEVQGEHLLSTGQWIGTRWPAFATSTGKAILAFLPANELEEILREPLPRFTPKTITSIESFRRELARIRKRGYAVADEDLEAGCVRHHAGGVGAPGGADPAEAGRDTRRLPAASDRTGVVAVKTALESSDPLLAAGHCSRCGPEYRHDA